MFPSENVKSAGQAARIIPFIHTLPNETLAEILGLANEGLIPSRRFALVCQRWRSTMLQTATFWRQVKAILIQEIKVDDLSAQMWRRLELAREVRLDVTLIVTAPSLVASDVLFKILGSISVERWRSLQITDQFGIQNYPKYIFNRFYGAFTSLTSLHINIQRDTAILHPIYRLFEQSSLNIRHLQVNLLPTRLQAAHFLRGLVSFSGPINQYTVVQQHAAIQEAELTDFDTARYADTRSVNEPIVPVNLPSIVRLRSFTFEKIFQMNCKRVQSLNLQLVCATISYDNIADMPCLKSLILPNRLSFIQAIRAPVLESLKLAIDWIFKAKEWRGESKSVIRLFKRDLNRITICPVSLDIEVTISTKAMLAVLSLWPQLQHLCLRLTSSNQFSWKGPFSRCFVKVPDPMCPQLITFELQTKWAKADSEQWKATVNKMFSLRSSGRLKDVSWTHGENGELVSTITQDLFPHRAYI